MKPPLDCHTIMSFITAAPPMPPLPSCSRRYIGVLLAWVFLAGSSTVAAQPPSGLDARIDEASGLTTSTLHADRYWVHNDSRAFYDSQPTEPLLYAIGAEGRVQGELWATGLKPYDWESVSAFRLKGKSYLLIGDIGDNRARRGRGIRLDVLEEPESLSAGRVRRKPAWTLRLTYPDGPRDAEAMAVDAEEGAIYILSKRDDHPHLYRADLQANRGGTQVMRLLGEIGALDAPVVTTEPGDLKVLPYTHQPTDMAFAPDRREVAVLTYAHIYVFRREAGQDWLTALRARPRVIDLPGARQYEGLSYTRDGKGWLVVREGDGATILRVPR